MAKKARSAGDLFWKKGHSGRKDILSLIEQCHLPKIIVQAAINGHVVRVKQLVEDKPFMDLILPSYINVSLSHW